MCAIAQCKLSTALGHRKLLPVSTGVRQSRVERMPYTEPTTLPLAAGAPSSPEANNLGLIPLDQGVVPREIVPVRPLGRGRAAEVRLVHATLADGRRLLCVEKVFC